MSWFRKQNDYCGEMINIGIMATRTTSSSAQVLMIILLIITFPLWFSVGAILFGVIAGLFGALVGVIGGLFGVVVGMIALPFKFLFGWGHSDWGYHWSPALTISLVILIVWLLSKNRK